MLRHSCMHVKAVSCMKGLTFMPGVKLVSKQACSAGRNPLVLAAGNVTFQTKSGALDSQLLPSHQPLKVSLHPPFVVAWEQGRISCQSDFSHEVLQESHGLTLRGYMVECTGITCVSNRSEQYLLTVSYLPAFTPICHVAAHHALCLLLGCMRQFMYVWYQKALQRQCCSMQGRTLSCWPWSDELIMCLAYSKCRACSM